MADSTAHHDRARPAALGMAFYHRLGFDEVLERVTAPLFDLLARTGNDAPLRLYLGREDRGPASAETLRGVEPHELTRGTDRALTIAPEADPDGAPWVLVEDPRLVQRRAVRTHLLAIVLPDADAWRAEDFDRLCEALDVRYAWATPAASVEAAFDEVVWPDAASRRATSADRRHSDAWIQLMRSFGRPDIDSGVPDIYWANAFGNLIVNELRRHDCWQDLEDAAELRYLDNGAAVFQLSASPVLVDDDDDATTRARRIGDAVAPLGLLQRALNQARQGDLLLLEALVATGDQRLLHGLAFAQGLTAFARLAGLDPDDVRSVDDARRHLRDTAQARPRGYGEPRVQAHDAPGEAGSAAEASRDEPDHDTVTDASAADAAADAATTAPAHTGRPEPVAVADLPDAALVPEPAFDRDSPQWRIDTMTRGSVRIELTSIRWTPGHGDARDHRHLTVSVVNDMPCAVELRSARGVVLRDGAPRTITHGAPTSGAALIAAGGQREIELELPAPAPDDELALLVAIGYRLRQNLADLLLEDGRARLVGDDNDAPGAVHDGWPARARVLLADDAARLIVQLTNTTQQPWAHWSLSLSPADAPQDVRGVAHGHGILEAGRSGWAALDTTALDGLDGGSVQVQLEAGGDVELTLATFQGSGIR